MSLRSGRFVSAAGFVVLRGALDAARAARRTRG